MYSIVSKIVALACIVCLSAALLVSCSSTDQDQESAASLNREYMSSVNRISNEAADELASFSEAASQGDLAAMRIAAANASETLAKISSLTAPDDLLEVHEEYQAGVAELSAALEDYVELYASVMNSSDGSDDASDGLVAIDAEALAEIQERYQSGIDHLSAADSMVAQIADDSENDQADDDSENQSASD